jgi:hypothetical protein
VQAFQDLVTTTNATANSKPSQPAHGEKNDATSHLDANYGVEIMQQRSRQCL